MVMSSAMPRTRLPCPSVVAGPGTGTTGSVPHTTLPWVASGSPVVANACQPRAIDGPAGNGGAPPKVAEERHELRRGDHGGDTARILGGLAVVQGQEQVGCACRAADPGQRGRNWSASAWLVRVGSPEPRRGVGGGVE